MLEKFFDLRGRVGLVSGAAQGLGRAMALALAEAGMDLVVVDRNTEGVRRTAEEIARGGRKAVPATCDVSDPVQIRALFAQVDRDWGRIDFLGGQKSDLILRVGYVQGHGADPAIVCFKPIAGINFEAFAQTGFLQGDFAQINGPAAQDDHAMA